MKSRLAREILESNTRKRRWRLKSKSNLESIYSILLINYSDYVKRDSSLLKKSESYNFEALVLASDKRDRNRKDKESSIFEIDL